jgi:hypothetical protein
VSSSLAFDALLEDTVLLLTLRLLPFLKKPRLLVEVVAASPSDDCASCGLSGDRNVAGVGSVAGSSDAPGGVAGEEESTSSASRYHLRRRV